MDFQSTAAVPFRFMEAITVVTLGLIFFFRLRAVAKRNDSTTGSSGKRYAEPKWIKKPFPWGLDRFFRIMKFEGDFIEDIVRSKYKREGSTHALRRLGGSVVNED